MLLFFLLPIIFSIVELFAMVLGETPPSKPAVKQEPMIKQEPSQPSHEKPVEKVIFTADIVSSRRFFLVLQHHAIVVKEIMLWKYLQDSKGFCSTEYLPIQIKYQSSGQPSVVNAYMESGSNELHDEQKESNICRKIRT
jgi:hypothetical protein